MPQTELKELIDRRLAELSAGNNRLREAMAYSLLAGGKRIRAILVLEFCRVCGGQVSDALDAACSVELLHAYSLIHDDLPCMDNDELRRGKPTNHIVYGEWLALLAGDALQAEAFNVLLSCALDDKRRLKAAQLLAAAAGANGICLGQFLDLSGEGKSLTADEIFTINKYKTAALIEAACMIGCACAGSFDKLEAAKAYGEALGVAFQLRDDILDVLSSAEELGKPIGSDERNEKSTLIGLLGLERCTKEAEHQSRCAIELIEESFGGDEALKQLTVNLADRKN